MMRWLRRLDHALLDRVFQPLANFLQRWAEPQVIAETLLLGAAVMVVGASVASMSRQGIGAGALATAAFNVGGATWLWVWYRRHGAIGRGRLNPFRELPVFVLVRVASVVMLLPDVLGLLWPGFAGGPLGLSYGPGEAGLFGLLSDVLTACGLYFAACTRPPPRAWRARGRLATASGRL